MISHTERAFHLPLHLEEVDLGDLPKLIHLRKDRFECDQCGRKFPEKALMKDHVRRMHPKGFSEKDKSSEVLKVHLEEVEPEDIKKHIVHKKVSGGKFKCEHCSKKFSCEERLKKHIKRHHKERIQPHLEEYAAYPDHLFDMNHFIENDFKTALYEGYIPIT